MPTSSSDKQPLSLRATRASLRRLSGLPPRVLRLMAGKPLVVDGQELRPEAQIAIRFLDSAPGDSFEKLPLPQARAELNAEAWLFGATTHIAEVVETTVGGATGHLAARLYDPAPAKAKDGLLVWFHGGGHVLGDLDTDEALCRFLARTSGLAILAVAYRLAPEHPYPAGLDDAVAATRHVLAHLDDYASGAKVLVGGESAGGGLAAAVAQRVEGLAGQFLLAPWLDLAEERPSHELFGQRGTLTNEQLTWYRNHFLPDQALATETGASPGRATDLAGLPRAVVMVTGFDPLRDEGLDYARRLEEAGVETTLVFEPGLPHSALNATGVSRRAREILDEVGQALREVVSR